MTTHIPDRELKSLRQIYPHFVKVAEPDFDQAAYGVKRLRAFLTGCGRSADYVELAAQDFVDTMFGASQ